jgi:hypothetical protein
MTLTNGNGTVRFSAHGKFLLQLSNIVAGDYIALAILSPSGATTVGSVTLPPFTDSGEATIDLAPIARYYMSVFHKLGVGASNAGYSLTDYAIGMVLTDQSQTAGGFGAATFYAYNGSRELFRSARQLNGSDYAYHLTERGYNSLYYFETKSGTYLIPCGYMSNGYLAEPMKLSNQQSNTYAPSLALTSGSHSLGASSNYAFVLWGYQPTAATLTIPMTSQADQTTAASMTHTLTPKLIEVSSPLRLLWVDRIGVVRAFALSVKSKTETTQRKTTNLPQPIYVATENGSMLSAATFTTNAGNDQVDGTIHYVCAVPTPDAGMVQCLSTLLDAHVIYGVFVRADGNVMMRELQLATSTLPSDDDTEDGVCVDATDNPLPSEIDFEFTAPIYGNDTLVS